ncbi:MAG: carbohydrate-binding family 9-like protein [Kiritimatiellia bacterium]|jgi:hypothetical protein|nr:carbohydrate-binding family 9-like protein [Kiritimatiellia bacterium]MDP6811361.1 carbohydrate-binding family 9-like protein [Kiritimatiellia bacterium]MDP7024402.1 carbohydrate-binding family 9-like protein [Kiritimatiellia bacterium]
MDVKELDIARIADGRLDVADANEHLAALPQHSIDILNWPAFDYRPNVRFAAGYGGGDLCVRFAVEEDAVLAEKTETNDSVCQDSCVEMFIAPHSDVYFNFEFNCIGTALVGRGRGRHDLECLDPSLIGSIRRSSSLGSEPFPERRERTAWQLTVAIPLTILGLNEDDLPGHTCRANFYKCGDRLSQPHYLSWNPINTPTPDFHRPECFGVVRFS